MNFLAHVWAFSKKFSGSGLILLTLIGVASTQITWAGSKKDRGSKVVKTIIVMRHAEDLDLPSLPLTAEGATRARFLATAFGQPGQAFHDQWPQIAEIFACRKKGAAAGVTSHSQKTVTPLAERLGLKLQSPYVAQEPDEMAKTLLADRHITADQVAVVAWTHENIPKLLKELGAKKSDIADLLNSKKSDLEWNGKVFDRFVLVEILANDDVRLTPIKERLLPSDSGFGKSHKDLVRACVVRAAGEGL